ncbi:transcriptional regulator, LysR family [Cupriavidus sp. YR651]|uniref:LysR family transcriptional regulator n=1 Tax=Cupriavidus sp. YR651 TaxID=1855315 RepID=UPI0008860AB0|nr:LysR family transcriptional regulator [Cupriavidus sp. YR651]SDD46422.1 transcriptional regulator, LysR family [Cupriavidus sp. YR651]
MNDSEVLERSPHQSLPNRADALSASFATSYAGIMAFMAVASAGSFAKASERLGIGRSAVSRSVQKLEAQLSTQLFLRTTRTTTLTREGRRFFENCHRGVTHMVDAMDDLFEQRMGPPRGLVRISASVGFGRKVVAPLVDKFAKAYPDITIDLLLDDRLTDFASDRVDVAFRSGHLEDSSLIAKQLIPMQMALVAAPSYVETHGLPDSPDDLPDHTCINFRLWNGRLLEWDFKVDGLSRKYLPAARLTFNNFDLVLQAALQGRGLALLPGYQVRQHIASKNLVVALPCHTHCDRGHYVCYPSRQHLPTRTRVFIDFMTTEIRALDLDCLGQSNVDSAL